MKHFCEHVFVESHFFAGSYFYGSRRIAKIWEKVTKILMQYIVIWTDRRTRPNFTTWALCEVSNTQVFATMVQIYHAGCLCNTGYRASVTPGFLKSRIVCSKKPWLTCKSYNFLKFLGVGSKSEVNWDGEGRAETQMRDNPPLRSGPQYIK